MSKTTKKLVEVALPLAEINDASAYDKMPGIGPHPKGIHHWWARLPLPVARSIIFASLVDDPSESPFFKNADNKQIELERERLFEIIRNLLSKKNHENIVGYKNAQIEIRRSCNDELPNFLDPFAGGGSIPLEANRLGLKVFASDLNPVPVLLNKVNLELIPKFSNTPPINPISRNEFDYHSAWKNANGLAADVNYFGNIILHNARKRLSKIFPTYKLKNNGNQKELDVITWIWARTISCPNPACGAEMPLISNFWLAKKDKRKIWLEPIVDKENKKIEFQVCEGNGSPPPVPKIGRAKFRCLICNEPTESNYIKDQGAAGLINQRLIAIVAAGKRGRDYFAPNKEHEDAAEVQEAKFKPSYDLPYDPRAICCSPYGMETWDKLYTKRQLYAMNVFSDLVVEVREHIQSELDNTGMPNGEDYLKAIVTLLAFALDRCADFNNSLSTWKPSGEQQMHLYTRGAISMAWDFTEANLIGEKGICWKNAVELTIDALRTIHIDGSKQGEAIQSDATKLSLNDKFLISTDPPYYDNIGYADLSDFFYVWLRRTIGDFYPEIFKTMLVPKNEELVASPYRFRGNKTKAKEYFENGFLKAFERFKSLLHKNYPMTIYYAFKQDEIKEQKRIGLTTGWETMLNALVGAGYQITATWPVRASQSWRIRAMQSNALASYIVIVCRPKTSDAIPVTRREFQSKLRSQLPDAITNMQTANIAPVDLAQSAIGPGMAIFSQYDKVLEADGTSMTVRTALALINEVLAEALSDQEGEIDEDSRWAIAWYEQYCFGEGPYGVAETLSTAKNTSISGMVEAGILKAKSGKVALLSRAELDNAWNPAKDKRLTIWEAMQHLIRVLENDGEDAAARLLNKIVTIAEPIKELAYRLYQSCERKGWADEARSYNGLVLSWPELQRLASRIQEPSQTALDL